MALRDAPLPDEPEDVSTQVDSLPGVSIADAAAQLGVSVHAVRRMVRSGRLASTRVARPQGWVVRVLLEGHHVAPPSAPGSALPPPRSARSQVAPPGARSEGAATQHVLSPPRDELVDVLKAQVTDLQRRLDWSEQAQSELRRLLAAALQQLALPEPSENRRDAET